MKNVLLTLICFVLFCGISLAQPCEAQAQVAPKTKPPAKFYRGSQKHSPQKSPTDNADKKSPTDIAELIFKRMDSNHDGSISLKEFKTAFPRLRQGYTRGSSRGRAPGFDGRTPGFRPPEGSARSHSRGSSPSRSSREKPSGDDHKHKRSKHK